jgi:uncharacterized protein with HEPN domain
MSKRSAELLLEDMAQAVDRIAEYALGLNEERFLADSLRSDAIMRNLQIIGEAASRLPASFVAAHPEVDWTAITGLRNRIVHDYFGIDLRLVWTIVSADLPPFKAVLDRLRSGLSR